MKATRRVVSFVTLLLGGVGVAVCVGGILGVWLVTSRLNSATDRVFTRIDSSLIAVQRTLADAAEHVHSARITSEDIKHSLKDWAEEATRDHLASRLDIEGKTERLASGLEQADQWLVISESSIQLVRQSLELVGPDGAQAETGPVDLVLEEIASLRAQLVQAIQSVETVREHVAGDGKDESLRERVEPAVRLAVRVVATLGPIESRLEGIEDKLSEIRATARKANTSMLRWTQTAAIGITFLILWMAAGQISLCRQGWQRLRQLRLSLPPDRKR